MDLSWTTSKGRGDAKLLLVALCTPSRRPASLGSDASTDQNNTGPNGAVAHGALYPDLLAYLQSHFIPAHQVHQWLSQLPLPAQSNDRRVSELDSSSACETNEHCGHEGVVAHDRWGTQDPMLVLIHTTLSVTSDVEAASCAAVFRSLWHTANMRGHEGSASESSLRRSGYGHSEAEESSDHRITLLSDAALAVFTTRSGTTLRLSNTTDIGLRAIGTSCLGLQSIVLSSCFNLTPQGLRRFFSAVEHRRKKVKLEAEIPGQTNAQCLALRSVTLQGNPLVSTAAQVAAIYCGAQSFDHVKEESSSGRHNEEKGEKGKAPDRDEPAAVVSAFDKAAALLRDSRRRREDTATTNHLTAPQPEPSSVEVAAPSLSLSAFEKSAALLRAARERREKSDVERPGSSRPPKPALQDDNDDDDDDDDEAAAMSVELESQNANDHEKKMHGPAAVFTTSSIEELTIVPMMESSPVSSVGLAVIAAHHPSLQSLTVRKSARVFSCAGLIDTSVLNQQVRNQDHVLFDVDEQAAVSRLYKQARFVPPPSQLTTTLTSLNLRGAKGLRLEDPTALLLPLVALRALRCLDLTGVHLQTPAIVQGFRVSTFAALPLMSSLRHLALADTTVDPPVVRTNAVRWGLATQPPLTPMPMAEALDPMLMNDCIARCGSPLRSLDLSGTNPSAASVAALCGMADAPQHQPHGPDFAPLAAVKCLRTIAPWVDTALRAAAVSFARDCTDGTRYTREVGCDMIDAVLQDVLFRRSALPLRGFNGGAALAFITKLTLAHCPTAATPLCLANIAIAAPQLETLLLPHCGVTDASIKALVGALSSGSVKACPGDSSASVQTVVGAKQSLALTELDISHGDVSDRGLGFLCELPLRKLSATTQPKVTLQGFKSLLLTADSLSPHCSKRTVLANAITSLDLSYCPLLVKIVDALPAPSSSRPKSQDESRGSVHFGPDGFDHWKALDHVLGPAVAPWLVTLNGVDVKH